MKLLRQKEAAGNKPRAEYAIEEELPVVQQACNGECGAGQALATTKAVRFHLVLLLESWVAERILLFFFLVLFPKISG